MELEANFDKIGKSFVQTYYNGFRDNRPSLECFYGEHSMLTWERKQLLGARAIAEHIVSLPFKTVAHNISMADCQPMANKAILVHVLGDVSIDEGPPIRFSQVFTLVKASPLSPNYTVFNDMFSFAN